MTALAELIAGAEALILDFDGPVCSVFAGHPPETVAAEMGKRAQDFLEHVPWEILSDPDPMAILYWSASVGDQQLIDALEKVLIVAECEAILTAEPSDGGAAVIRAATDAGMRVGIASNNSSAAIKRYLSSHPAPELVTVIVGRPIGRPERMKPDPLVLDQAVAALDCAPGSALFVGDSLSDITAAKAAGVPVIAFANKAPKVSAFTDAEPDALILSMQELAEAFQTMVTDRG